MDIKDIHQDQFKEAREKEDRLRRVSRVERVNRVREIKDSEKDKEESKNKRQEITAEVVIKQADKGPNGTTIELTEKASRIGDIYEAQNHMMGQHIGHIDKLRASLNDASEKEAIETVAAQNLKMKKAKVAYKNGENTAKRIEEPER